MSVNISHAKCRLRDALALLSEDPRDDAVNRALDAAADVQAALTAELASRTAERVKGQQQRVVQDNAGATDRIGRSRSPVTLPGYHRGRAPANKGQKLGPTPPTAEEIFRMLAQCDQTAFGERMRALVYVLWRAGLRISEALALIEDDLDPDRSSVFVRKGKNGLPRTVGVDSWVWDCLKPWRDIRLELPVGAFFCVIDGPTAGKAWSSADVRKKIKQLASAAGIRRRVAPHQLRHACAVQMREDGFDIVYISRHLGHQDLAITTHYMRGINDDEIINAVRQRQVPQIDGLAALKTMAPVPVRRELVEHV